MTGTMGAFHYGEFVEESIEGFDEKDGEKYKAFCKAQHKLTKQLRQMGVVHGDLYQPNMLWNEEMQQFMAIDFEQGTLMPKKHPNKPYLYPKRMRNSSDPENAKRPGGLLAAQIKHTEGHCDSVHQRLSGALKPTDSFLAIQLTDPPLGWHVNFGRRLTFGSKWIGYYWARRPYRSSDLLDVVVGPVAWPELFEREFPYSAADDINREWFSGEQFGDGDTHKVLGFSECLPGKQGGFLDAGALGNWEPGNWEENFTWAYGYEGAVLPGGRIMMGRWRKMMSQEWDGTHLYSGNRCEEYGLAGEQEN
uniref:Aminoglycoside phosphotransferase domain-containing protein n=1 Tax=Coccidioides posadasii RMSCC 3488 TaxID=454284 RepID=A0A0J6FK62_COCPO|nr:hypothetical protein CPAG_09848 [Coccidioides posadasii RMSCC 3488]